MKILRIYLRLPPCSGGMEKHIAFLSQEQLKAGHQVTIFYNSGDPVSASDIVVAPFLDLSATKPAFLGAICFYFLVILKVLKLGIRADVVHVHGDWGHLCLAGVVKKIVKARCLAFSVHGELSDHGWRYKLLRFFIKPVDVMFATGFFSYQILSRISAVPCYFQPSGVDDRLLNRAKDFITTGKSVLKRPVILSVCNYKKVKNIDFIILLASKMLDYDFEIIGDGEERQSLQDQINTLGLSNVLLLGEKYGDELASYYEKANLFLLTSFREGTPTAVLEALAFGLPVVTSNAGGISHLLGNYPQVKILTDFECEHYSAAIRFFLDNSCKKIDNTNVFGWSYIANAITEKYL